MCCHISLCLFPPIALGAWSMALVLWQPLYKSCSSAFSPPSHSSLSSPSLHTSFPGADDNSLFQKFERQHKSHPHYRVPQLRHQNPVFTIVHYASDVTYSVKVCGSYVYIQLDLPTRDTMGPTILSLVERSSLSQRSNNKVLAWG